MNNEEKKINSTEEQNQKPKMRRLLIETDGNKIVIVTNEMTGLLELKAVLTELITNLR